MSDVRPNLADRQAFDSASSTYESWYEGSQGQRAERAERRLLTWLLEPFPAACRIVEIGSGTGRFTEWLTERGFSVIALDSSRAMVEEMRGLGRNEPAIIADAHRVPIRGRGVDLSVFVTTLEFLEDPEVALRQAVRVASQGIVVLALHRWSMGGLSRRWGPRAHSMLRARARDYSVLELVRQVKSASGPRLRELRWSSSLFPGPLHWLRSHIALGDVVGVAATLV